MLIKWMRDDEAYYSDWDSINLTEYLLRFSDYSCLKDLRSNMLINGFNPNSKYGILEFVYESAILKYVIEAEHSYFIGIPSHQCFKNSVERITISSDTWTHFAKSISNVPPRLNVSHWMLITMPITRSANMSINQTSVWRDIYHRKHSSSISCHSHRELFQWMSKNYDLDVSRSKIAWKIHICESLIAVTPEKWNRQSSKSD